MTNGRIHAGRALLTTLAGLCLGAGTALAEQLPYRVAFAYVPGIEDIQAGKYDAAIERLERRRQQDVDPVEDELATLCGVYVISRRYREAREACEQAVRREGGAAAWNNRGVLRAHFGDVEGAMRDFARVRIPEKDLEAHIETLKLGSVPLMATANMQLAERMQDMRRDARHVVGARALRGADVEDILAPEDDRAN